MTESADRPDRPGQDSEPAPTRDMGETSDSAPVTRPRRISYVDGARLRRAILAGVQHVTGDREELDRINVFPVPDGDTGTNLALSLAAIADAVRPLETRSLTRVADAAAEASIMGARGNSGMLFSRFLLTFADRVRGRDRIESADLAAALTAASASLDDVLENPREGTIITVARDMTSEATKRAARSDGEIYHWLKDMYLVSERSLARTTDMLEALREAGVVDAGAKGFVSFFDGVVQFIDGRIEGEALEQKSDGRSLYHAREAGIGSDEGRYCTQIAVQGPDLPDDRTIRDAIHDLGTSTIVLHSGNLAKIHIHADAPADVIEILSGFGRIVSERIEDTLLSGTTSPVAVVVDSASDLPHEWTERHGVAVVPIQITIGDRTYRDGVDIDAARLYELMHEADDPPPVTTSQPSPGAFSEAYLRGAERGAEGILGIYISSQISGTYGTGAATMRTLDDVEGIALDSRSGSLGSGLLAVRAVELLDEGVPIREVARELERIRDQSNVFFTVDTLEYLLRSGRVGRARAWFGTLLDLKPILSMSDEGRLAAVGRARGMDAVLDRVFDLLDERLVEAARYRFGVVHFAAEDWMQHIVRELDHRYDAVEIISAPATAALGVHVGPGAWAVAYQIED